MYILNILYVWYPALSFHFHYANTLSNPHFSLTIYITVESLTAFFFKVQLAFNPVKKGRSKETKQLAEDPWKKKKVTKPRYLHIGSALLKTLIHFTVLERSKPQRVCKEKIKIHIQWTLCTPNPKVYRHLKGLNKSSITCWPSETDMWLHRGK